MKQSSSLFIALLFLGGSAAAQAPVGTSLQPVQTIALGTHVALAGSVQLANHNLVLVLSDTESPNIHLQCLLPNGSTAWEVNIARIQGLDANPYVYSPIGETIFPRKAMESKELVLQHQNAQLVATQIVSDGNTLYAMERIEEKVAKHQPKGGTLVAGQVFGYRVDDKGQLSHVVFPPPPAPESNKVEVESLGRYADSGGYVEIMRATNKREETEAFFLDHYDFGTKNIHRESFTLPPPPKDISGMSSFREWYQEWGFLGHRPNQTYYCRRTLVDVNDPLSKPGKQPLIYQVYLTDDHGATTGGFSTNLDLAKGTSPRSSGHLLNSGELDHIPLIHPHHSGSMDISYDGWDNSTGCIGSFYLDRANGEVVIYGDYGDGEFPENEFGPELKGYFQRRYASDGKVVDQLQSIYSPALRQNPSEKLFAGGWRNNNGRRARIHFDPISHQSEYSFWRPHSGYEWMNLSFDNAQKLHSWVFVPKFNEPELHLFTAVRYPEPFMVLKTSRTAYNLQHVHDYRVYEHATNDDPPLYTALEKLRRAAGPKFAYHEFHLSLTGPSTGLVVERRESVGGNLQVYTF